MKSAWMCLTILMAGLVGGCGGTHGKLERAVTAALAPEAPRDAWFPALQQAALSQTTGVTPEAMRQSMGSKNFTSFVLTLTRDLRQDYAWEFGASQPAAMARYLKEHSTLVARQDVRDLQWTQRPDGTYSGSFSVSTSYGLKATLLFAAREQNGSIEVTKLAVAKKQSRDLSEGFLVFQIP